MSIILEAKDLKIIKPTGNCNDILLKNVNLTLKPGDAISISGNIGLGKTSLIRILGLLAKPQDGNLYIKSPKNIIDTTLLPRGELDEFIKYYFAYIFQSPELMMKWTVTENISLPLMARGNSKKESKEIAEEFCYILGILKYANVPISTLSTGCRKLVDIAKAMAKEPAILIADEPTENLDPKTRDKVIKYLIEQQSDGILIIATHLKTTESMFKKRYVIEEKRLIRKKAD